MGMAGGASPRRCPSFMPHIASVRDLTLDPFIDEQSTTGYEAIRTPASSIASSVLTTHRSVDSGVG